MNIDYAGLRLPDDFRITVCSECKRACCWQGEFMCDGARNADIRQKTIGELKSLQPYIDGEHWEWWEKDIAALEYLDAVPAPGRQGEEQ